MIDVKLNQQWLDDDMPFAFECARQEKREQQEQLDKWDF